MQFLYDPNASDQTLHISGDNFKYLSKVRRIQVDQEVNVRNLNDPYLYSYKVTQIDKRQITLQLYKSTKEQKQKKQLHLGWCVVDPKTVEKTLPFLNEIGVSAITFIYCQKSQRNFKLKFDRLEKILINSSQQCGRDSLMKLFTIDSIDSFIQKYPQTYICDFGGDSIKDQNIETIIIGPEGGFCESERSYDLPKVGFNSDTILKSETAVTAIASKLLV